jgi:hypothetical protein
MYIWSFSMSPAVSWALTTNVRVVDIGNVHRKPFFTMP